MEQRRAEREAWKQEVRRRAKFDPMAMPKRPAPGAGAGGRPGASTGAGPSAASGSAAGAAAASPPPLPALNRPRAPVTPNTVAALRAGLARPAPPALASGGGAAAAAAAAATPVGSDDDGRDVLKPLKTSRASNRKAVQVVENDDDEDDDDDLDLEGMTALAKRMFDDNEEDEDEDDGEAVGVADGRRAAGASSSTSGRVASAGTPHKAVAGVAASRKPQPAYAPKRQLMSIAQMQRQLSSAAAAAAEVTEAPGGAAGPSAAAATAGRQGGLVRKQAAGRPAAKGAGQGKEAEEEGQVQGGQEDDELDWDALEAYEKYEQYVNEVAEEQQRSARAAARRSSSGSAAAAAATSSSSVPASISAASSTSISRPAASRPSASSSVPAAAAGGGAAGARRRRAAAAEEELDAADLLDKQLDEWEQLVNFFQAVEKDSKREAERRRRREEAEAAAATAAEAVEGGGGKKKKADSGGKKGGKAVAGAAAPVPPKRPGATAKTAAAAPDVSSLQAELEALGLGDGEAQGEVEVDWAVLERMFLGEGWEAELEELKAKVEAGALDVEAAMAAQEGGEGAAAEPWRDEVSTLLMGLMEISAKRYLGRSLLAEAAPATAAPMMAEAAPTEAAPAAAAAAGAPAAGAAPVAGPQALSEEGRAVAFWEAPFLLLVQDDSADPLLEYGNRTALAALGLLSFDDATAGLPVASLLDPSHPASQQEWLWGCAEVAEKPECFATIRSLRLRGPGPGALPVLASDVTLFRVDSLEGEPIATALVAASWRRLTPEEAAAGATAAP